MKQTAGRKLVVVGAGFGGLAAAALMAKNGWDVTVLEKNSQTGGRARIWESQGYRFDMGPSWYLMPEVFENFFGLFGRRREQFYPLVKLDPSYRVFFGPQEVVDIREDLEEVARLFESFEPGGGQKLRRYLELARYKYEVAMREFLYRNYRSVFDFLNRRLIVEGVRLNVFGRLDRLVGRFFHDRRARQILEYAMVFLGTNPKDAPGLYSIMSHMDLNQGVFYPAGGLAAVAGAIHGLAESQGARLLCDQEVRRIEVRGGQARKLITTTGEFDADAVLVNADYAYAETQLLEERYRSLPQRYWRRRVFAPSMFVLYLGLNRKLANLLHHNLYFAPDWDRHFDAIFKRPSWPPQPCFYVSCISKTDPPMAPPGKENVFVLVPVAPGMEDTDEIRERYAEQVLRHLEVVTGEQIRAHIEVRRIYSHRDFRADYNAYLGTALGLSHTLGQTAVFRPPFTSRKVGNLFYAGQYTHPGVGVPMVLIAAQVVAGLLQGGAVMSWIHFDTFKSGSKTYFNSSLFFPASVRRDVFALYGFVRVADDFVDRVPQDRDGFHGFSAAYRRALRGERADNPIIDDFVELARRKGFDPAWTDAFLHSMELDLSKTGYDSLGETLEYIYGSAEVIGLFMARIMDLPQASYPHARMLGRAMQYINFVRDIDEDRGLGRRYLPLKETALEPFVGPRGIDPETAHRHPEAFREFLRHHLALYRGWQAEAEKGYRYIPRRYRLAVKTAADMYNWTASRIERDPPVVFRRKVKPSRGRIFFRVAANALGA